MQKYVPWVVALCAAGVAGYGVYLAYVVVPQISSNVSRDGHVVRVSPDSSKENQVATTTADWKIFSDVKNKYSFSYPPSWLLREDIKKPGWVSVTPMNPLPYATEIIDVSFELVPFNSAAPYESIESDDLGLGPIVAQRDCTEVIIGQKTAYRCSPMAIPGFAYLVPTEHEQGVLILDTVARGESVGVVNSLTLEKEPRIDTI